MWDNEFEMIQINDFVPSPNIFFNFLLIRYMNVYFFNMISCFICKNYRMNV